MSNSTYPPFPENRITPEEEACLLDKLTLLSYKINETVSDEEPRAGSTLRLHTRTTTFFFSPTDDFPMNRHVKLGAIGSFMSVYAKEFSNTFWA